MGSVRKRPVPAAGWIPKPAPAVELTSSGRRRGAGDLGCGNFAARGQSPQVLARAAVRPSGRRLKARPDGPARSDCRRSRRRDRPSGSGRSPQRVDPETRAAVEPRLFSLAAEIYLRARLRNPQMDVRIGFARSAWPFAEFSDFPTSRDADYAGQNFWPFLRSTKPFSHFRRAARCRLHA